jgi:two-component system C4-dicarboxylate transport sensor histidine kinase DctB
LISTTLETVVATAVCSNLRRHQRKLCPGAKSLNKKIFSPATLGMPGWISAYSRTDIPADGADFHTVADLFGWKGESGGKRHVLIAGGIIIGLVLVSVWAGVFAGRSARVALERQMTSVASLEASRLETELERYRAIPFILSRDSEVVQAVGSQDRATRLKVVEKLNDVSRETNVGSLYVRGFLGQDAPPPDVSGADCGRTVASVYEGDATTAFPSQQYFCNVLESGVTEGFAVSRLGRPPGMYFARPIVIEGQRAGMVGAKAEFDGLEKQWAADNLLIFVTDKNGVVIISSVPEWRFQTLRTLSAAARADLNSSERFGPAPLSPLPIDWEPNADGLLRISIAGARDEHFVHSTADIPPSDWQMHILTPASEPVRVAKYSSAVIVLFSGLLMMSLMRSLHRGRLRQASEAEKQAAIRNELERRVEQRTSELQEASVLLQFEMDERRKVARKVNSLREELVQANKLAILGQVTAGVAHEINQPVAAIRTYADSALLLLQRNDQPLAEENLRYIGELTERISLITQELRSFSRRTTGATSTMDLSVAIEGALLLSNHRLTMQDIEVVRLGDSPNQWVVSERVRLEQVLVNLIQNAVEAMEGADSRRLTITVEDRGSEVAVHIQDSGSGLSDTAIKDLFMPFMTTKPNGLGLGLVICTEIITEFGGELSACNTKEGARFTFTLRKAVEPS